MESFTPVSASIGGALIGLSAVILMAFNGRIAGISGIFCGAALGLRGDRLWRILFVLGLVAAPLLYIQGAGKIPEFSMSASLPMIVVGGLLVGFGTRLGSGCTSGHGVCGLSRLSLRSLVSVSVFMGAGMITVTIARALLGAG